MSQFSSLVLSLVMLLLITSCTSPSSPTSTTEVIPISESESSQSEKNDLVTEPPTETAIHSCEELFGLWDNFETEESDTVSTSLPAMLQQVPEEISNLNIWEIESLESVLLLGLHKIPNNVGNVWVVDDRNEQDEIFEPVTTTEMAELFNTNLSTNSDSEDMILCVFRGLHSTQTCDYGFSPLQEDSTINTDSWQHLAYLFAVGAESNEYAFLGIVEGETKGCPSQIELGERIVGPELEPEQIVNVWNESLELNGNEEIGQPQHTFLKEQRLNLLLFSEARQYLILLGTENNDGQLKPILVDSSKWGSYIKFGLANEDQLTYISIQEVEILNVSAWQKHETESAILYTLEAVANSSDLHEKDYQLLDEPIILIQDGNQMQEPESGLAATIELDEPDILIDMSE